MPLRVRVSLLTAALVCCGCASQVPQREYSPKTRVSGEVTGGVVDAPASERYSAEQNARYEQPLASPDNSLPTYPEALLSKHLPPVSIQVRVIVDEMGNVADMIPAEQLDPSNSAFLESVHSVVQTWTFTQLVKIVPGSGTTVLRDTFGNETTYSGHATALPFHQDYRFVFSQSEGKANVTARSASPPGS